MTADVKSLQWAAEELDIGESTAYRLGPLGHVPGAQSKSDPAPPLPPTETKSTQGVAQVPKRQYDSRFGIDALRSRIPPWGRERLGFGVDS